MKFLSLTLCPKFSRKHFLSKLYVLCLVFIIMRKIIQLVKT